MSVTLSQVRALREKYTEMLRLRIEHARGGDADPRPALIALARRFPGALRELDQLPLADIERRIAALESVIAGVCEAAEWMRLQVSYHGTMRAVLRIKRIARAAGDGSDGAPVLDALAAGYEPLPDEPTLASFSPEALAAIVRPPGGRLNPFVYARVASQHGVDAETVRAALFLR